MIKIKIFLLLSLLLIACGGTETFLAIRALTDLFADDLTALNEVVVETDDPINPYKYIYLGETNKAYLEKEIRVPDKEETSGWGYGFLEYCFIKKRQVSVKDNMLAQNCNAVRFHYDNKNRLYDYEIINREG